MATKVAVVEVNGNASDVQTSIQTTIDGLTIASGSEPSISVAGSGSRKMVFILYRDA